MTEVRRATTVCVLRPGPGVEVLMVRRADRSAFMGGAHVFPGGAIDGVDEGPDAVRAVSAVEGDHLPWVAAGLREVAEEAGILITEDPVPPGLAAGLHGAELYRALAATGHRLAGPALAYLSNWVTPPGPPRRFDTRFYVTEVPAGTEAHADETEVTEAVWVAPRRALQLGDSGEWKLYFPTVRHLELLADFDTPAAAVAHARSLDEVERVAPRMVREHDGSVRVLVPGDRGYDQAPR